MSHRSSSYKRVLSGISDLLCRFETKRRRKSFVASAAVDSIKPQKGKRLSKHERRAKAESFVVKYKESNSGKFPSTGLVRQEVGGSYYILREILQEMQYCHKFGISNKIASVQLGTTDEDAAQSFVVKEETSTCNEDESIRGNVNGPNSDAVQLGKQDAASEQISGGKEYTPIQNEDLDGARKLTEQSSDSKELSVGGVTQGDATMFNEQRFDPKGEPSTSNIEDTVVKVHSGSDTKKGFSRCSGAEDKEDSSNSFQAKADSAVSNEDEILKDDIEGKDEHLVFDALTSHSRESILEIDSSKETQNMKNAMKDEHVKSDLQEHHSSEHLKKPDDQGSTGMWSNLISLKDRMFRFWTNL